MNCNLFRIYYLLTVDNSNQISCTFLTFLMHIQINQLGGGGCKLWKFDGFSFILLSAICPGFVKILSSLVLAQVSDLELFDHVLITLVSK